MMSVLPLTPSTLVVATRLIPVPDGAVRGNRSQDATAIPHSTASTRVTFEERRA
jgi:hypothetical protein